MQGDVSKIEDNADLVNRTVQKWGQVDAIIFNAGTLLIGASTFSHCQFLRAVAADNRGVDQMSETPLGDLSDYTALNLLSIPYLLRPALPHLRQTKGRIIMISSGVSLKG